MLRAPHGRDGAGITPVRRTGRDAGDVGRLRERRRRRRTAVLAGIVLAVVAAGAARVASGRTLLPAWPSIDPLYLMSGLFFAVLIAVLLGQTLVAGRSPHVVYRPEQIDVTLEDVKGLAPVKEDVERSLDLFLSARSFRRDMGGRPRRGLLFEGSPGTGKTHMAKAMAHEAGVPFLFVSATSFQSMWYGATARKVRSYFRALRKAARAEGGAIAFIEEIDAIAAARGGMAAATPAPAAAVLGCGGLTGLAMGAPTAAAPVRVERLASSEGASGVVNELLVQMQSFDEPTASERLHGWAVDAVNRFLPAHRRLARPRSEPAEVLVIAATNRADALDPALLRPGRFDRRLTFGLPDKTGRRELVDHFLAAKAHEPQLDDAERRDALAGITNGYSPVMIENLLDEALVNAVRRGADGMSWADVEHARLVTEVGLGQPVGYTAHEERLIATHEAGHATVAWLVAPQRRLEVLTIVKRADALGLLAHGDAEDVYTRSRAELAGFIKIAFGGQVAEELFFGDVSTGPAGDLQAATSTAAQMVGAAGMAGTLVSFAAVQNGALADGNLVARVLGDAEGRRLVESLLAEQKGAVRELLERHRYLVAALRDALLERHELIGREITDVLEAAHAAHGADPRAAGAPRVLDLRDGAALRTSPGTPRG
ncbi:AAA family ATPase [Paenibacillus sp. TRM 82003]|uniref:AAA family ATPase n=1 Tax=Kineococcus sp. TRM81007 TaxID=2925831 RepID=UPI001F5832FB|nr:AAA family ATPase [Kineococcus sp. TRM81007]MCI2239163.1 AAA family ATPase [Kineococcus sp. TRM81007]MCI3924842.1 AAA family ATPase [Paenibacillus sp. TRM 82003]